MAPQLLLDLSRIDMSRTVLGPAEIEAVNPQRGQMRQIDGIFWINESHTQAVGYKDVRDDEFWVAGHIPGRPLLPGVMMIEAAAQLAGYLMKKRMPEAAFIGFVGCDRVKFRGQVTPGQRLILLGREIKFSRRRLICAAQGVVEGALVFEGQITGMPI